MNGFNSYETPYWQGAKGSWDVYAPQPFGNPIKTNIIRVTSLEEAIMRTVERGSDMVYFDQDKDLYYRVQVDMDNRKTWATFSYRLHEQNNSIPAPVPELQKLTARVEALEAKLSKEVANVERDGQ